MKLEEINKEYDNLQNYFGASNLRAIYGGGCTNNAKVLFVFMNPTATNLASNKEWKGINAPFIGTKTAWKVFNKLGLFNDKLLKQVLDKKPQEWNIEFASSAYDEVKFNKFYVTNFGKCTQIDARSLNNDVFNNYLKLLEQEIEVINPSKIICFGNQVSSLFLNKKIEVSKNRKIKHFKKIGNKNYETYAVYYPIGLGFRNIDKVIEDIKYILN